MCNEKSRRNKHKWECEDADEQETNIDSKCGKLRQNDSKAKTKKIQRNWIIFHVLCYFKGIFNILLSK